MKSYNERNYPFCKHAKAKPRYPYESTSEKKSLIIIIILTTNK